MSPEIIAVVVGIFGALFGVYFREVIERAKLRLSAAVALESTLFYWFDFGMKNEHLSELLVTGQIFGKKEMEAIRSKDIEEIKKFHSKIADNLKNAKEKFLDEQKENIGTIISEIQKLSDAEYEEIIAEIGKCKDSISDFNGFLSQEKLTVLDWHMLPKVIELKAEVQSLLMDLKLGIIHIHTHEEPNSEKISMLVFSIVTTIVKASKNVIPLIESSTSIRQKGLLGNLFF